MLRSVFYVGSVLNLWECWLVKEKGFKIMLNLVAEKRRKMS